VDKDVHPRRESIFSSNPFCFRVVRVFCGSNCLFQVELIASGGPIALRARRPHLPVDFVAKGGILLALLPQARAVEKNGFVSGVAARASKRQ